VALAPLPFLIGRNADNHLVLRDNRVSRSHLQILAEDDHYVLEDLNSRHGTWVNGVRVARHLLRNSDRIDFGVQESYQLTFTVDPGEINRLMDRISTSLSGERANHLAKLRSLMEVARALQNSLSTQEVLTAVVDASLAVTACERGFLLLRNDTGLEVSVARDKDGRPLEADELRVPTSVINSALNSRRDLLSMSFDPAAAQSFKPSQSIAALELRSVVCLPLVRVRSGSNEETRMGTTADATVGMLYLDSRTEPADLSPGSRELLQTLAIEASTILENARLMDEQRVKQRLESELRVAREIQQGLLPVALPSEGWFRAAGSSLPAMHVGGDYFDVRQLGPSEWAAVVADVSGKGVSSALLASLLQGAFLMASAESSSIESMLQRLNLFLLDRTRGEKYATVFYCRLNSAGWLSYANAGHCPPYLLSSVGGIRKLDTQNFPVGMLEEAVFDKADVQLAPGDKLVLYSDGLTETENAQGEFFDTRRLQAFLLEHAALSAAELHSSLLASLDRFSEGGVVRDDVTLLVLEYAP